MPKFDHEYCFIRRADDESLPAMTPDEDTEARSYMSSRLPPGEKPLRFYNGAYEWQQESGILPMAPPPDILFDGSDILVKRDIGEQLRAYDIPNLAMYPAVYMDHKDAWHEDYVYLSFIERFDCWDREHSSYDPEPLSISGAYDVMVYSLNDELLEKTPLAERRLFKMGHTLEGMLVAHTSIAHLFNGSGTKLVPIAEY